MTLRNRKFVRKYIPVIPREPLLMAPGPVNAPARTKHQAALPPMKDNLTPRPGTPCNPTPDAAPSPPLLPQPSGTPRHAMAPPPTTTAMDMAAPESPPAQSQPPSSRPPRALRALAPFNKPGPKEAPPPGQPLSPAADLPCGPTLRPRTSREPPQ